MNQKGNQGKREVKVTDLLKLVPNRFMLCVGVSRRARQLKEGAKPMVEVADRQNIQPVITALEEIEKGKVTIIIRDEAEQSILEELDELTDSDSGLDIEEPVEEVVEKKVKETKKVKVKSA